MKELKEFTVEGLERLIRNASGVSSPTHFELSPDDIAALAKIALAAKRAKPSFDEWLSSLGATIEVDCGCVTTEAFYHWIRVAYESTPPLNHTEQHMVKLLRNLVDVVWSEAKESEEVPSTKWADEMIAKVYPVAAPKPESES